MFACSLKIQILHHRHPSDIPHYSAKSVTSVNNSHKSDNNWQKMLYPQGCLRHFRHLFLSIFFCFHARCVCGAGISQCAIDFRCVSSVCVCQMWVYLPPLWKHKKLKNTRNLIIFAVAQRGRQISGNGWGHSIFCVFMHIALRLRTRAGTMHYGLDDKA